MTMHYKIDKTLKILRKWQRDFPSDDLMCHELETAKTESDKKTIRECREARNALMDAIEFIAAEAKYCTCDVPETHFGSAYPRNPCYHCLKDTNRPPELAGRRIWSTKRSERATEPQDAGKWPFQGSLKDDASRLP